jgi:hypothetical protein
MAIIIVKTQAEVDAVPDPKFIWYDISRIVIYTGADINIINPPPTQDQIDRTDAMNYAPLQALIKMTPAQVQAYIQANVTNLAQAQTAIETLAVAVGILARNL